jgi:hypothetical protein
MHSLEMFTYGGSLEAGTKRGGKYVDINWTVMKHSQYK